MSMKRLNCSGLSGWSFGLRGMSVDLHITPRLHALEAHANRSQTGAEAAHSGVPVAFVHIFLEFGVRQAGFCEGADRA